MAYILASSVTYAAYAPAGYDPSKLTPLLIALHGAGDTADGYLAAIWRANADTRGFLVLAAEGSSKLGTGFTYSSTDARYIANELLTDFARCYTVDPKKRVLNGFAAGGVLAYSMGLGGSAKDFADHQGIRRDGQRVRAVGGDHPRTAHR